MLAKQQLVANPIVVGGGFGEKTTVNLCKREIALAFWYSALVVQVS